MSTRHPNPNRIQRPRDRDEYPPNVQTMHTKATATRDLYMVCDPTAQQSRIPVLVDVHTAHAKRAGDALWYTLNA